MPSWRSRSPPLASTTACWRRPDAHRRGGAAGRDGTGGAAAAVRPAAASARLWLACQRGDLATARQAMRSFDARTEGELGAQQRPPRLGPDEPRHRGAVVAAAGRGPPRPGGGARARAPHRPALPGGRLPRPPRAGRDPRELATGRRAAAERGGGGDRRAPRMGQPTASSRPRSPAAAIALAWLGRIDDAERWLDRVAPRSRPGRSSRRSRRSITRGPSCGSGRAASRRRWQSSAPRTGCMPRSSRSTALRLDVRGLIVLVQALQGDRAAAARARSPPWRSRRARRRRDAPRDGGPRAGRREPAGGARRAGADARRHGRRRSTRAGRPSTRCCSTPRRATGWGTGPARRRRSSARSSSPSPTASSSSSPWRPSEELLERHPRHRTSARRAARDDPRRARGTLAGAARARRRRCGRSSARRSCGC